MIRYMRMHIRNVSVVIRMSDHNYMFLIGVACLFCMHKSTIVRVPNVHPTQLLCASFLTLLYLIVNRLSASRVMLTI